MDNIMDHNMMNPTVLHAPVEAIEWGSEQVDERHMCDNCDFGFCEVISFKLTYDY